MGSFLPVAKPGKKTAGEQRVVVLPRQPHRCPMTCKGKHPARRYSSPTRKCEARTTRATFAAAPTGKPASTNRSHRARRVAAERSRAISVLLYLVLFSDRRFSNCRFRRPATGKPANPVYPTLPYRPAGNCPTHRLNTAQDIAQAAMPCRANTTKLIAQAAMPPQHRTRRTSATPRAPAPPTPCHHPAQHRLSPQHRRTLRNQLPCQPTPQRPATYWPKLHAINTLRSMLPKVIRKPLQSTQLVSSFVLLFEQFQSLQGDITHI